MLQGGHQLEGVLKLHRDEGLEVQLAVDIRETVDDVDQLHLQTLDVGSVIDLS